MAVQDLIRQAAVQVPEDDVMVITPEEMERYKDSRCLVLYPALREGKVIYERALSAGWQARSPLGGAGC